MIGSYSGLLEYCTYNTQRKLKKDSSYSSLIGQLIMMVLTINGTDSLVAKITYFLVVISFEQYVVYGCDTSYYVVYYVLAHDS